MIEAQLKVAASAIAKALTLIHRFRPPASKKLFVLIVLWLNRTLVIDLVFVAIRFRHVYSKKFLNNMKKGCSSQKKNVVAQAV
jgi:hypothetical protein